MFDRWLDIGDGSALIIGPRRCGKTTYLRMRFPDYAYATLDDFDLLAFAKKDPKGFVARLGKRAIIDEIQRHPPLTIAVKYAIDNEGARILMTGSSSIGLLDAAADTLAGRIDVRSLPTMCFGEEKGPPTHRVFDDPQDPLERREAARALDGALRFGLFPEIVAAGSDAARAKILSRYKNSYFTRDLMLLANIGNADAILALYLHLARSLGSHLEVAHFAREASLSHATAKKYLSALDQAQLAFRLTGHQFGPAKRLIRAAKSYFADGGVLAALPVRASEGQILESFVISELEKRRKLGLLAAEQLHYYKSAGGREVDVVFEAGGTLVAAEVKATARPSGRDLRNLREFAASCRRPVRCFLFYLGDERIDEGSVTLLPVAALYRGR
jgi:uncharacterized protein